MSAREPGLATLGATKIAAVLQCPRRAYYTYVEGHREPTNAAMARGTASHDAIDFALRRQIGGKPASLDEVADAARDRAERIRAEVDWSDEDASERNHFVDRTIAYAVTYARDVAPTLRVLDVERPFRVEVDGVAVGGRIDVLCEDGVRDTKTVGKAPVPAWGEPRYRFQLGLYALAMQTERDDFDAPAMTGAIDFLVLSERTPRATKADPFPTTTREVRHLPVLLSAEEMAGEMDVARETIREVADVVRSERWARNPTACFSWMRPCPHMGRCMPHRASVVERAEAAKTAGKVAA